MVTVEEIKCKALPAVAGAAAVMAPGVALAEGETSGTTAALDGVTSAVTGMATTVETNALDMIGQLLPVIAPIVAAVIIVRIGVGFVKRFGKG